jgi:hypothetical protein
VKGKRGRTIKARTDYKETVSGVVEVTNKRIEGFSYIFA